MSKRVRTTEAQAAKATQLSTVQLFLNNAFYIVAYTTQPRWAQECTKQKTALYWTVLLTWPAPPYTFRLGHVPAHEMSITWLHLHKTIVQYHFITAVTMKRYINIFCAHCTPDLALSWMLHFTPWSSTFKYLNWTLHSTLNFIIYTKKLCFVPKKRRFSYFLQY